jgi:hypothetical protein
LLYKRGFEIAFNKQKKIKRRSFFLFLFSFASRKENKKIFSLITREKDIFLLALPSFFFFFLSSCLFSQPNIFLKRREREKRKKERKQTTSR